MVFDGFMGLDEEQNCSYVGMGNHYYQNQKQHQSAWSLLIWSKSQGAEAMAGSIPTSHPQPSKHIHILIAYLYMINTRLLYKTWQTYYKQMHDTNSWLMKAGNQTIKSHEVRMGAASHQISTSKMTAMQNLLNHGAETVISWTVLGDSYCQ